MAVSRIKLLEWSAGSPGSYTERAMTPWGVSYVIYEINGRGFWRRSGDYAGTLVDGGLTGAKQACQNHFETMVRSSLL